MVSVQRRLNSTGRKRITRDRVKVDLSPPSDVLSFPSATVEMDLGQMDLDPNAKVILEAYFRSSSMRFQCGTVRDLSIPRPMILTDIDRGGAIQFRLLVIAPDDSGRILAAAEGLRPKQTSDSPDRQPLLTLRETDIGEEIWRVDIDDRNGPVLVINSRVPGLSVRLRTEALVQGLILPHAMREILRSLPVPGEDEGDQDWGEDWRKFLAHLNVPVEPDDRSDEEAVAEWIDEAIESFTTLRRFAELVRTGDAPSGSEHG